MNTKHTPGPWLVDRIPIKSSGGSCTCWKIGPMSACIYDDGRPRRVGISESENEANARLIAASPDLLFELDRVVSWFEQFQHAQRVGGNMLDLLQNVDLSGAKTVLKKATSPV